jgi:release factor glutamine methyltransferase
MKRVHEVLSEIIRIFNAHHLLDPKRQAEELLCDLLNCTFSELFRDQKRLLSENECLTAENWIQRRLQGEPLAYLSGKVEFYGCTLEINPSVLIPRPETEILVDKVAQDLKKENLKGTILWDICCGSGCMGIALKKTFPALTVYLSDCSAEALALATRNAAANGVDVVCLKGDLLAPFLGKKAHVVVCNPPYISEEEYASLDQEVKEYEPRLALVAGRSGLEIYERLARELPAYLYPHAKVWLEIGYQQGKAMHRLFQGPPWKNQRMENDWAGHNRFFFLENE